MADTVREPMKIYLGIVGSKKDPKLRTETRLRLVYDS